jgi:iron complex outermembrane receptor protein
MRRFILFLFSVCCSFMASAQTGSIIGSVRTSDGQSAPFVNINLRGENMGVTTDTYGNFIIEHVKEGSHIVVASFVGHESQEKSVSVTADHISKIDFDLKESIQQLSEVQVIGTQSLNEQPVSVGKISINPMDLPQSTMVIDRSILDKQQALNVGDVLMNTNGVYIMGTSGGTQQEIAARGFAFGSNNTFKNGVRFNNTVMPELTAADRIEIVKGSAAILYGQVGAGGIMNIVTKKPRFQNGGMLSLRAGSFGLIKPSVDFYGSVNGSEHVAFRVNSSYENAGSFRDKVHSERIYFNPSFLIKAGKKTEILVEGDYLKDNRNLDFGTASVNYKIADVPRSRYLNTSWSYFKAEQKSATINVMHHLNDIWQLNFLGSYQGFYQDQYGTTRPNANGYMVKQDGTWVRGLQRSGINQDYFIAQVDLTGKFKTGSVEHTLLVGADIDKYATTTVTYAYQNLLAANKNVYDSINIYNLNAYKQRNDVPDIALYTTTKNPINRVGVYVQDFVTITEKIKVLAGIRYSYVDNRGTVYDAANKVTGLSTRNFPHAFTPRVGLIYQPAKSTSLFASYSNSFDVNIGVDFNGKPDLPPSLIDQYEAGIKNEIFKGLLSVNLTAYKIVNSNTYLSMTAIDPKFTGSTQIKANAGAINSKGFELDVMSKPIRGFSLIGGYSFNDTRYGTSPIYIKNSRLRYNPQHTANLSVFYTFNNNKLLKGLVFGFTSNYIGKRVAGRSTRTNVQNDTYKLMTIPDYFLFDLSAGYSLGHVSLRVKVSNLLNELSYNVHDDNSVNPIAPRQFSATLSYKL